MPAIYLFQKRTLLGGDDLQVPALVTIGLRGVQLVVFLLPLSIWLVREAHGYLLQFVLMDASSDEPCRHSHFFPLLTSMYLMASTLFCLSSLLLEHRIWYWTCQGTPTQRQPRTERIEALLECKLFVFTVLLALIVMTYLASTVFSSSYLHCRSLNQGQDQGQDQDFDDVITVTNNNNNNNNKLWVGSHAWWIMSSFLVLTQVTEIILAVLYWVRLVAQAVSAQAQYNLHLHHPNNHESMEELWAERCHCLCQCLSMSTCCLFGGQDLWNNPNSSSHNAGNNFYEHVAQALADYLETRGTLDVVPTDLVTGLLILQRLQRQRILQARLEVVHSSQTQLNYLNSNMQQQQQRQRVASSPAAELMVLRTAPSTDNSIVLNTMHIEQRSSPVSAPLLMQSNSIDIPTKSPNNSSLTLRSRVSSNELNNNKSNNNNNNNSSSSSSSSNFAGYMTPQQQQQRSRPSTPLSRANSMGITKNGSANSLDLPETTRLMVSSSPAPSLSLRVNNNNNDLFSEVPHEQQIFRRQAATDEIRYQPLTRQVLNPHNPVDGQRLLQGARMAKYALAIYTWMLYVFVHPVTGMPQLLCRSCRLCRRCKQDHHRSADDSLLEEEPGTTTIGDNLCQWHKHSLLLVAGIPEADLIYANFENRVSFMPYCILLDHETQSVVVAIRGSLSLEDLVTDVYIDPEPLEGLGREFGFEAQDQYCHAGVVAVAQNVYMDLQRHGLLEQLLQHGYPDYHLRLVGHSLGAATSTLLGYMLQPQYPSLKVYNFSPPGMTMTWDLATRCEPWTTTFILDADLVPRLSVPALEDLRNQVLDLVGRLKVPKYQVIQSFWNGNTRRGCCWGTSSDNATQDLEDLNQLIGDILNDSPSPPDTVYHRQLQEFLQVQEQRKQARGSTRSLKMYPPGRMIHLLKTGEEGGFGHVARKIATCCTSNSGFQYTPVYIANDDLDEIVVSPTMGTDHFVDRMVDELTGLAEAYNAVQFTAGEIV